MPASENSSSGGGALRDQLLPDQLGCCRTSSCVHQLHRLVYCYYGFRPFLDNAQVQLNEASGRTSSPAEETRSRSGGQTRRRAGRGGSRGSRGRQPASAERSTSSRSSTPTSGQGCASGQWQTQARAATPASQAQGGEQGRGRTVQKQGKTAVRSAAAAAPVRSPTPSSAETATPPAAPTQRPSALLPTPSSSSSSSAVKLSVRTSSRSLTPRSRPITISASAPVLRSTPPPAPLPPPLPPAAPDSDRHLAAILDRLSLLATPPGALPAFVRVPPPSAGGVFCGSRSHGSLEVELGRCQFSRPAPRRRHRSGGTAPPEAEGKVGGGATWDPSPPPRPCCPGVSGHRDSYDPRLDVPPAGEERTREQVRSERLLKNFDMFRDWNYVPFAVESSGRSGAAAADRHPHRRASSIDSSSDGDSDSDLEPTVTICSRVGGVFHYIPAQRLLKNAAGMSGIAEIEG